MKHLRLLLPFCLMVCLSVSCSGPASPSFDLPFTKYTLENGLQVILHEDKSDPVVAVAVTYHVGSAREKVGRTGFAHLFEHLLFLESENLGKGGLDKLINKVGGQLNGFTTRDRTTYYQTVPSDALEKIIWAEADKLGYFINTVTNPVFQQEKQVVKNEKRQNYDNVPYGHSGYVIASNLYPKEHPYNWQVIGSLEDLQNATLDDVKEFYRKWYVPNNATLVVAGDFDEVQTKAWVEKYFGEIPRGKELPKPSAPEVNLSESKKFYHEDNFARLPQLSMTWPTVPNYHPDSYPLSMLISLLSEGQSTPFYQVLVKEQQLCAEVDLYEYNSELAGEFHLSIQAFPNVSLNQLNAGIEAAFAKFESEGISEKALSRVKAGQETDFYNGLSSVLGKAFNLAQYNVFTNDPGFVKQDLAQLQAVTPADVQRVYEQYIKGKPFVSTSFVPKGQRDLALSGAVQADILEEKITIGAEQEFDRSQVTPYEKTASQIDRSVEPPYGDEIQVKMPQVWKHTMANELKVYGIEDRELPLVEFELYFQGGMLLDNPEKVGVANFLANMMQEGTKSKTPEALEAAIDKLGSELYIVPGTQNFVIRGNCLAKNYTATIELLQEMLLYPRWDEEKFPLVKQRILSRIKQLQANPNIIANQQFNSLLYGDAHILSQSRLGSEESVNTITMEDLQAYYEQYLSPSVASFMVVGAVSEGEVRNSLAILERNWEAKALEMPSYPLPQSAPDSRVYFYDIPNAKQSALRIGYLSLSRESEDFYPAVVANYILGGGGFASQLMLQLREAKGYTYGIGSSFRGTELPGPFIISSNVRSNITLEAISLIKEILEDYGPNFTETDLENTQNPLLKGNALAFETLGNKLNVLRNIHRYNLADDYLIQQEQTVKGMEVSKIQTLANQYLAPEKMIYLIVGDAATQLGRIKQLGLGEPVLLNPAL